MKLKSILPVIIAIGFIGISNISNANAYFTTYVTAKGGYSVNWKHEEHMEESFTDWNKYVTITSKPDSIPVFVRVKAFAGTTYSLDFSGSEWSKNDADGYYYYNIPLNGGETTTALKIFIDNIPINPQKNENFNVVVVYETVPAQFDEAGNPISPMQADWTKEIAIGQEIKTVDTETETTENTIAEVVNGEEN